jgi:hypothetical protein
MRAWASAIAAAGGLLGGGSGAPGSVLMRGCRRVGAPEEGVEAIEGKSAWTYGKASLSLASYVEASWLISPIFEPRSMDSQSKNWSVNQTQKPRCHLSSIGPLGAYRLPPRRHATNTCGVSCRKWSEKTEGAAPTAPWKKVRSPATAVAHLLGGWGSASINPLLLCLPLITCRF